MAKSTVKAEEVKEAEPRDRSLVVHNVNVYDFAALIYYGGKSKDLPKFETASESDQEFYSTIALAALIALDKMNKMVTVKVENKDVELNRNKNVFALTGIIENFVKNLKVIKCPKCGSHAEIRPLIFPCTELANRIWDGK